METVLVFTLSDVASVSTGAGFSSVF